MFFSLFNKFPLQQTDEYLFYILWFTADRNGIVYSFLSSLKKFMFHLFYRWIHAWSYKNFILFSILSNGVCYKALYQSFASFLYKTSNLFIYFVIITIFVLIIYDDLFEHLLD